MRKYISLFFVMFALVSSAYGHPAVFVNSLEDATALQKEIDNDIILIFSSKNCSFCEKLQNDLISMNIEDKIICVINIDKNKELKQQYGVSVVPDTRIISNGKEKKKIIGYKDKQAFIDKIQ